MNCDSNSFGITSQILMTMSKIPALSQKVLAEWLRMTERLELFPGLPDLDIVGHPVILDDRNYFSWQKLFGKNHALLSRIQNNWLNSRTFVANYNFLDKFPHIC